MNFICPGCSLQGDIADEKVPPQGVIANCPKCGIKFKIQKEESTTAEPLPDFVFSIDELSVAEKSGETIMDDRPTAVTVIGWIFIGMSGLMLFSALMSFAAFSRMPVLGEAFREIPPSMPPALRNIFGLFRFFPVISLAEVVVACLTLFAGICFLKRRAWARTFLEGFSWVSIVLLVLYLGWWGCMWVQMTGIFPAGANRCGPPLALLRGIGIAMAIFNLAVFAAPLGFIIYFLRKASVRAACDK